MAVPVTLPNLETDDAEGVVAEWYRPDGATVDIGELVCRVEASFIAFEIEADGPGLLRHRIPVGGCERSGGLIAQILERGESPVEEEPADLFKPIEVDWPAVAQEPPTDEVDPADSTAFEDHLVEAVVVPFPGAFAGTAPRGPDISEEPVSFDPALFGEEEHERTTTLIEPGGSIPGLPLWEPDEIAAAPTALPVSSESHARFSRISSEAAAASQTLVVSIAVNLTESQRMRAAFDREWRTFGEAPMLEDVVFRALSLAIEETAFAGGNGAMLIATPESDLSFAITNPASLTFRQAVTARVHSATEALESASWTLVSLRQLGVSMATSRLERGSAMSFALAAPDVANRATLTMTYDTAHWNEGSSARLLARVRDILEVPYTMLT